MNRSSHDLAGHAQRYRMRKCWRSAGRRPPESRSARSRVTTSPAASIAESRDEARAERLGDDPADRLLADRANR